jgi:hypothetical protein
MHMGRRSGAQLRFVATLLTIMGSVSGGGANPVAGSWPDLPVIVDGGDLAMSRQQWRGAHGPQAAQCCAGVP